MAVVVEGGSLKQAMNVPSLMMGETAENVDTW